MVISTQATTPATAATNLIFNSTSSNTSSVDSFAQQLLTAIEGYLNQSGKGSSLEIDVQGSQGQNSGGNGQFVVTVKNLGAGAPATSAGAASTVPSPNAAPASIHASSPILASATVAPAAAAALSAASFPSTASLTPAAVSTSSPSITADQRSKMSPDQAYWASQPPAVQALQYTPDDQRGQLAQDLANQGYTIDVPIMVWNWDPLATMVQRQMDGYSWVPALGQTPVTVAPGLTFPGGVSYDASKPPAGSIEVTTAFAKGTNGQDAWIKNVDTTTGDVAIT